MFSKYSLDGDIENRKLPNRYFTRDFPPVINIPMKLPQSHNLIKHFL